MLHGMSCCAAYGGSQARHRPGHRMPCSRSPHFQSEFGVKAAYRGGMGSAPTATVPIRGVSHLEIGSSPLLRATSPGEIDRLQNDLANLASQFFCWDRSRFNKAAQLRPRHSYAATKSNYRYLALPNPVPDRLRTDIQCLCKLFDPHVALHYWFSPVIPRMMHHLPALGCTLVAYGRRASKRMLAHDRRPRERRYSVEAIPLPYAIKATHLKASQKQLVEWLNSDYAWFLDPSRYVGTEGVPSFSRPSGSDLEGSRDRVLREVLPLMFRILEQSRATVDYSAILKGRPSADVLKLQAIVDTFKTSLVVHRRGWIMLTAAGPRAFEAWATFILISMIEAQSLSSLAQCACGCGKWLLRWRKDRKYWSANCRVRAHQSDEGFREERNARARKLRQERHVKYKVQRRVKSKR